MTKFWFYIRLYWLVTVILYSIGIGLFLTTIIVLVTLLKTGGMALSMQSVDAIWAIASFWFTIAWVLGFLLAIILSFKTLFNKPIAEYYLEMLGCDEEILAPIILTDVMPLWRKFLFWMIWLLLIVVLIMLGVFNRGFDSISGINLFIYILILGFWIIKPIILSDKRIHLRKTREDSH